MKGLGFFLFDQFKFLIHTYVVRIFPWLPSIVDAQHKWYQVFDNIMLGFGYWEASDMNNCGIYFLYGLDFCVVVFIVYYAFSW